MPWNWQLPDWPHFSYEKESLLEQEKQFLLNVGSAFAFLKNIGDAERVEFLVEILSNEGVGSSKIEGETLDRESLQSSIKKHFGLQTSLMKEKRKESGMAKLLCDIYETFDEPLSEKMLCQWHRNLFQNETALFDPGQFRVHDEPMQIVSHRLDKVKVFFEAPPSKQIKKEMAQFIHWFNHSRKKNLVLERAAIGHLYFESIHPFEDGNGRIGRALIEKMLSQEIGKPILISISKEFEKRKKEYYAALESCNCTLEIQPWLNFFADALLKAQKESINQLFFLIKKSKMFYLLAERLNPRQEKVLLRLFAEGPSGFIGGLSAEKYIAITKTSKATATRDLQGLVEMGALIKTGELRHTRYWLYLDNF